MQYDVVAMGAGHNGLVAAAYLAKAGKKVLVLERQHWPGGGVVTREINTPGYKHDTHSIAHVIIQANPMITEDELGLMSKFGLEYRVSDKPAVSIFPGNETLITYRDIDRTCAGIAKFSQRDAEAYRRFANQSMAMLPMFVAGMFSPPVPFGPFMATLDSSEEGREIVTTMGRSALEVVNGLFEDDRVKMHLLKLISEHSQLPDDLGTGLEVFLMPGFMHGYGVGVPVGGSGKLTEALVKCIEANGGEVRCNAEVTKIKVSGGKASGVVLSDGEEFDARDAVIGSMHPHLLGKFVDGIAEPVLRHARQVTLAHFTLFCSWYDLKKRTEFRAGDEIAASPFIEMLTSDRMSDFLDDFAALRRRRLPERPLLTGVDQTHADPTRAPEGGGTLYSTVMVPYEIEGKGAAYWNEIKEAEADKHLRYYRNYISNLTDDNILMRSSASPLEVESSSPNSFVRACIGGCASFHYQTGSHRPNADLGQYTVPGIDGLYLVGPALHPGGGVMGGGRATAVKMFDDLGIDFDKAIRK